MARWKFAYFLLLASATASLQPETTQCSDNCSTQKSPNIVTDNTTDVTPQPKEEDQHDLLHFIRSTDFTSVRNLTLRSLNISNFNFSKFYNITNLDLSRNNIITFHSNLTFNTVSLNLSNNSLKKLRGSFPKLNTLDLSNNQITNITWNISQTQSLEYLNLKNNYIKNISNLSSITLKSLILKNNKLTQLEIGNSPQLIVLDLSYNFISHVHTNVSLSVPNLEILNLSSNSLEELKDYRFNFTNLLKLDLKNNSIRILSARCFYGLTKLQFLDVSSNRIVTVRPSTLQYLTGLIHLYISNNSQIDSQDFGLLLANRRLKSVDASKTNQMKIPSSLTRSVRYLELSYNMISQIQSGDLDSYPLLNSLNLANNNITYIEDDAFGRLDFLITLNLNENYLTTVPHTLPNNLKNLQLNKNYIKTINSNDFEMPKLINLDLSFNKITNLKDDTFQQLFNLEKLNLSGNDMFTLPKSFAGLKKLKVLDLSYLTKLPECKETLCFPVPEYNNIQELKMVNSTNLVHIFLQDVAALKTFKQLSILNLSNSNLTSLRRDLPNLLPRLNELDLRGESSFNISIIKDIFSWFIIKEIELGVFSIREKNFSSHENPIKIKTEENSLTSTGFMILNLTSTEESLFENKSDLFSMDPEFFSNELWYGSEEASGPGVVDAFSAEEGPGTGGSHPGLLILLVLPVALILAALLINYSRGNKRTNRNIPPPSLHNREMDIEISNISSELW